MSDALTCWIWVQRAVGAGSSDVPRLLEAFSTAEAIYRADRAALMRAGIRGRTLEALCRKDLKEADKQRERCARLGWMLTPQDELYPESLRHIYSPPLVLYGKGRLPDFSEAAVPAIAMVGTRECTTYGIHAAAALSAGLAAAGCPIISGGARGIDRAAHEGALYAGGSTVILQACGLDVNYPFVNRDLRRQVLENGGAILTEFAPGTIAHRGNFRIRNRLISGLARGVCIVEAPSVSGALITARAARDQGRDVFVVPGRVTDEASAGSNALIREGAALVACPSDILSEYPQYFNRKLTEDADRGQAAYYEWLEQGSKQTLKVADAPAEIAVASAPAAEVTGEPKACPEIVSDTARTVYACIITEELAADEICEREGLTPGEVFAALTELELFGCVESRPGKRYIVSRD
ncbi:MAG: DNA-processing protein DprA [Clostridia bacterium]|nr:DNA-processing protein DprA [Clostridia bacterium]